MTTHLLQPGQIFTGRYRVERFLAQGGMGAVFVAEQIATELQVAIKVLFPHVLASSDAIEKFQLEARVAARVKSDHIVQVLDAGFDQETELPFLVMELLEGRPLEDVVLQSGPLPAAEVVTYIAQSCSGLDKAHGYRNKEGELQSIVHRDLKPENLFLVNRDSGEAFVKILDFGIAKVVTDTANLSQELKGTPLYMAFEQASGARITPQTDIWAVGLIAFFLLTGRAYWRTASDEQAGLSALFGEVLTQPIVAPTERARELGVPAVWPPAFDDWFSRCVHREPSARYPSAGEAAVALAAALGVEMGTGLSGAIAPLAAAAPQRDSGTPIIGPEVTTGVAVPAITGQPTVTSIPGVSKAGSKRPLWVVGVLAGVALVGGGALLLAGGGGQASPEPDAAQSATPAAAPSESPPPVQSAPAPVDSAALAESASPPEPAAPKPARPPVKKPGNEAKPKPPPAKPPAGDVWNER